jgi:hypothetical protein
MKQQELLQLAGAMKSGTGFKLPNYKRLYTRTEALERIAKDYGAKSYKDFQNANREKRFKDYARRMERANIQRDKDYFKDYFGIRKAVKSEKGIKKAYSKVVLKLAEKQRQEWRGAYS